MRVYDYQGIFDNRIKSIFKEKPEVISFLLKHERREVVLTNLKKEILFAEFNRPKLLNQKNIITMVNASADLFCNLALKNIEDKLMSDCEKQRRIKEADAYKNAQEAMKELSDEASSAKISSYAGEVCK